MKAKSYNNKLAVAHFTKKMPPQNAQNGDEVMDDNRIELSPEMEPGLLKKVIVSRLTQAKKQLENQDLASEIVFE